MPSLNLLKHLPNKMEEELVLLSDKPHLLSITQKAQELVSHHTLLNKPKKKTQKNISELLNL
jgi:hypothetical protein